MGKDMNNDVYYGLQKKLRQKVHYKKRIYGNIVFKDEEYC